METLTGFISDYGLWAVAVAAFFEGQAVLVIAGIMAGHGVFRPMDLLLLASTSAWFGHVFWYALGRTMNRDFFQRRFPGSSRKLDGLDTLIRKQPWTSVIFLQYGYGIRLLGAIAFGITRIPPVWFGMVQILNCAVWAALLVAFGYSLGFSSTEISLVTLKWSSVAVSIILGIIWVHRLRQQSRLTAHRTIETG